MRFNVVHEVEIDLKKEMARLDIKSDGHFRLPALSTVKISIKLNYVSILEEVRFGMSLHFHVISRRSLWGM